MRVAGRGDHNPAVTCVAGCDDHNPAVTHVAACGDHNPAVTHVAGRGDHDPAVTRVAGRGDHNPAVGRVAGRGDHNPAASVLPDAAITIPAVILSRGDDEGPHAGCCAWLSVAQGSSPCARSLAVCAARDDRRAATITCKARQCRFRCSDTSGESLRRPTPAAMLSAPSARRVIVHDPPAFRQFAEQQGETAVRLVALPIQAPAADGHG
ncbi:MAG: hypothetical protein AVDCRST_MAG42-2728 [uncultured Chthoniobacterales bacterium]|uniref:Uncharacterized protein n=1 Tax=uncultured Chthoniobacterales bacterium TaxID=1836801 RepID=A0A6J4ILG7_9BACT|nr:MAG: hypothetical protein AVDCRST_MAG42-2728 [uncultured Chthoniobacterales bacterium]